MEPTDNELLQPIAPVNTVPDPPQMVTETQSDDTEILEDHSAMNNNNDQGEQITDKMERKKGKGKGQLVVQNFQLARNCRPKRKFSCVGCPQKFDNNRKLNDHFKNSHLPLTCSDCKKLFLTLSAFEKHKYTHYEFMFECGKCNKGFHFESELLAHRRKHISDQGLVCFHANCGRRFKRNSELNAHLKKHTGKPIKCAYCDYSNKDIRNVRTHTRVHLNVQGFVCAKCGKRFKWGSQKKTTFGLWEVSWVVLFQNWFVITFLSSVCTFYIFFLHFRLGLIVKLILETPDLIFYFILSYNIHFFYCVTLRLS